LRNKRRQSGFVSTARRCTYSCWTLGSTTCEVIGGAVHPYDGSLQSIPSSCCLVVCMMLPLTWLERRWTCDARKTRWISTRQCVDDLVDPTHRSPEYHCHPNHLGLIHVVIQRPLEVSLQDQMYQPSTVDDARGPFLV
jgi:hypothetical protein